MSMDSSVSSSFISPSRSSDWEWSLSSVHSFSNSSSCFSPDPESLLACWEKAVFPHGFLVKHFWRTIFDSRGNRFESMKMLRCQNSHGQGPRIPGPKTLDGTNSAKRPRQWIALAIDHSHTTYIVPLFAAWTLTEYVANLSVQTDSAQDPTSFRQWWFVPQRLHSSPPSSTGGLCEMGGDL